MQFLHGGSLRDWDLFIVGLSWLFLPSSRAQLGQSPSNSSHRLSPHVEEMAFSRPPFPEPFKTRNSPLKHLLRLFLPLGTMSCTSKCIHTLFSTSYSGHSVRLYLRSHTRRRRAYKINMICGLVSRITFSVQYHIHLTT